MLLSYALRRRPACACTQLYACMTGQLSRSFGSVSRLMTTGVAITCGASSEYRCRTYATLKFCHLTAWSTSVTQTRQPSRFEVACEPAKNARWSTPSISRSSGIGQPAHASSVVNMSV